MNKAAAIRRLMELEEPWREQAIANCRNSTRGSRNTSDDDSNLKLSYVLIRAFNWHSTPEGRVYWSELYYDLYQRENGRPHPYANDADRAAARNQLGTAARRIQETKP